MTDSAFSPRWMIYGANGYTGRLAAAKARADGERPILAGRNRDAIGALGSELDLETRIFSLDSLDETVRGLEGVAAVLHCAGPFSATSAKMLDGCVRSRTHYLDITGEIEVFEHTQANSGRWKEAGISVIPGVGFDVVPSDCLAALLAERLSDATHLRMAFKSKHGKLSPGTSKTMVEGLPKGGMIRRGGKLEKVPNAYRVETLPFADGPQLAVTIPWGDVSTAFYSTGIPNIEIYIGTTPDQVKQMKMLSVLGPLLGLGPIQALLKGWIGRKVEGPSDAERAEDEMQLWGEVRNAIGETITLRMRTPEGYSLTVDASVAATLRVLHGGLPTGALTPSKAFGSEFVLHLPGVELIEPEGNSASA